MDNSFGSHKNILLLAVKKTRVYIFTFDDDIIYDRWVSADLMYTHLQTQLPVIDLYGWCIVWSNADYLPKPRSLWRRLIFPPYPGQVLDSTVYTNTAHTLFLRAQFQIQLLTLLLFLSCVLITIYPSLVMMILGLNVIFLKHQRKSVMRVATLIFINFLRLNQFGQNPWALFVEIDIPLIMLLKK